MACEPQNAQQMMNQLQSMMAAQGGKQPAPQKQQQKGNGRKTAKPESWKCPRCNFYNFGQRTIQLRQKSLQASFQFFGIN
eukprot:1444066-Amphidinium_carterae.1